MCRIHQTLKTETELNNAQPTPSSRTVSEEEGTYGRHANIFIHENLDCDKESMHLQPTPCFWSHESMYNERIV